MSKHLFSSIFGAAAIVAVGAVSATAADDIEAKAQVCSACHGQNGVPTDPKTIPIIWGQQLYYIDKQLHDYKSGDREHPIMSVIAKGLDQKELRPMAAYFSAKPWPAKQASAPAASPPNGIAQCQACHQPKFEGGPPAPRLAGLSYEYLIAAMNNFANDVRTNNGDMPQIMKALSQSQREAMAHYIAGL
jgi:cytochrome c553